MLLLGFLAQVEVTRLLIAQNLFPPDSLISFIGQFLKIRGNDRNLALTISETFRSYPRSYDDVSRELKGLKVRYDTPRHEVLGSAAFIYFAQVSKSWLT